MYLTLQESNSRVRSLVFVNDTKDFHSSNVPGYWYQVIGRSLESMQIQGKVADEC
jgi:hypothetical protein